MKFLLSVLKCLIVGVIIAKTQRPNFRGDYRYEKAFKAFYKVHTIAQEWHTARLRCEAEGTELMVPDNLDEADVLPLLTTDVLTKYEGVYVGMHDMYSERTYVTLNGSIILGSILDLFWEFKEPKYGGGRCVAMRRSGRLFVHPCEDPLPFICKISAAKVTFNQECNSYNLNWTVAPNKSCYLVHTEPQNWRDAYSTCLLGGGHLAVLDDRAEAEYIKHLFKQVEEKRMPSNDIAFLGFNDLFEQHHYRTVFGVPIQNSGFADWDMKCSASAERNKSRQKRCGGLRRSGLLVVEDCDIPAMFFCEKPANKSTARTGLRSRNLYYT